MATSNRSPERKSHKGKRCRRSKQQRQLDKKMGWKGDSRDKMLGSSSGTTGLQSWMSEQSPGKGNPTEKSHSELAPSKTLDTVLVSVRIRVSHF